MAKRIRHRLTAIEVAKVARPGRYSDGGGLYLVVDGKLNRRWVFRYRINGGRRDMGLGPAGGLHPVTLADARRAAMQAADLLRDGFDPLDHRTREAKAQAVLREQTEREANTPTFGTYADAFVTARQDTWRNDKHRAQWSMTLARYCQPFRDRRIDRIDTEAVLGVLRPLWARIPETAQRLRGRIERVLDAAKAEGHRSGENPARWRGHLDALLPKRTKLVRGHHAALPFDDVPRFMRALREREAVAARLLEFAILTASRPGEAFNATWAEIDLDKGVWTIPATRMKAGREHRVPLSERAKAILAEVLPLKRGRYVFPGHRGDAPLSNMAMAKLMERMGYSDFTAHGFRSSFRDWAAETTNFPQEVCEMALAHTIQNKAEAAYRRGDLYEKRRQLMEAWAQHCERQAGELLYMRRSA